MSAYLIVDMQVFNAGNIESYRRDALELVKKYGGAPVGLDPKPYVYEGDWVPRSLLLLEFPNMQAIDRLLQSDEYAPLADLRRSNSHARLVAFHGFEQ
ncbi:DUF1330 domain-containing protein [Pseudoxanthomonas sp. CF125]|uniref:DUF1330 domain-containing protein n=1 Tax=Pseudoxanthomonas sp. CF125 TaxID=1855303 RepID=UPI0008833CA1|nr:DUF1330 domain-containing protein [Pseudoxanthomonas sp. CF125]SDR06159.1 Uncharacterized conserved protein, DUF1330 family [Pseudoxanthomonas sp. CF125]